MSKRLREFERPTDLKTAIDLLSRIEVATSPLVIGPRPEIDPYANVEAIVDLSGLKLDGVSESDGAIHIGAQTTLQTLIDSPILKNFANGILPEAARLAAHLGLRNVATLGGAFMSREGPPEILLALLALNATIVIQGNEWPLTDSQPSPEELLLEVKIDSRRCAAALARVARSPLDAAIVAAVAVVTHESARVAVAGAGPQPICKSITQSPDGASNLQLQQQLTDAVVVDSNPIPDYRGSAEYRKAMAGVLAKRALMDAWNRTQK